MNNTLIKMMEKKLDKLSTEKWATAQGHWMALLDILEEEE